MDEKSTIDQYIDYINENILQFIDYSELQQSYDTDMVYAKGVLNRLHEAMVEIYRSEQLDEYSGEEGFVVVPGIVRGRDTGKMCIALLNLDLTSSGEHWGTSFLCEAGVVSQNEAYSNEEGAAELRKAIKPYGNYDYGYTATIFGDIHVDDHRLPKEISQILQDFRNHRVVLQNKTPHQYEGVTDVRISEQDFKNKMKMLLPGASDIALMKLISYANELDADGTHPKGAFFSESYVSYNLALHQYGAIIANRVLNVCEESCLNPWEILGAAELMKAGVAQDAIITESINGTFDLTQLQWDEVKAGLEALRRDGLDIPTATKPSVLSQIRDAAKEPKEPAKPKNKKKAGPEL